MYAVRMQNALLQSVCDLTNLVKEGNVKTEKDAKQYMDSAIDLVSKNKEHLSNEQVVNACFHLFGRLLQTGKGVYENARYLSVMFPDFVSSVKCTFKFPRAAIQFAALLNASKSTITNYPRDHFQYIVEQTVVFLKKVPIMQSDVHPSLMGLSIACSKSPPLLNTLYVTGIHEWVASKFLKDTSCSSQVKMAAVALITVLHTCTLFRSTLKQDCESIVHFLKEYTPVSGKDDFLVMVDMALSGSFQDCEAVHSLYEWEEFLTSGLQRTIRLVKKKMFTSLTTASYSGTLTEDILERARRAGIEDMYLEGCGLIHDHIGKKRKREEEEEVHSGFEALLTASELATNSFSFL